MKYKIIKQSKSEIELEEVTDFSKTQFNGKTLEWGNSSENYMIWDEAQEWCKKQGKGWRLPTVQEIISSFDYDKGKSFIPGFVAYGYWSSTTVPSDSTSAYNVYMPTGNIGNSYKSDTYYVRCVR